MVLSRFVQAGGHVIATDQIVHIRDYLDGHVRPPFVAEDVGCLIHFQDGASLHMGKPDWLKLKRRLLKGK